MTLSDHEFLLSIPTRKGFAKCTIDNNMYADIYTLGIPNRASSSGFTYFCGTDKGNPWKGAENAISTIYHELKDYVDRRIGTKFEEDVKDLIPYVKRFEKAFPYVLGA